MKNIMLIILFCSSIFLSLLKANCIDDFKLVQSAKGIEMCSKDNDVVQIIDLKQGAKIEFLYKKSGDMFQLQHIGDMWNNFKKNTKNAFSIVNGTFFSPNTGNYQTATKASLAFLLKKNEKIITKGYESSINIKTLKIIGSNASIDDDSGYWYIENYPNVLAGLSTEEDKNNWAWFVGRNLIGVNNDGSKIYILVTDGMAVDDAEKLLKQFGATNIMMLDGSGSAQLRSDKKNIIGNDGGQGRLIPQAIGIISGSNQKNILRAEAIKYILNKFNISSKNAGFNHRRFGEDINIPSDVSSNTDYYDYIVTAYNRGIVSGINGVFEPNREVTLAEFLVMIVRAIPIPMNNPNYKSYDYHYGDWYYKYLKVAYNAGLIDNKEYSFDNGISQETANNILNKAYNYFMGKNSGISIYGHWTKKYVDFDVYLYSKYDGDGTTINYDKNNGYSISNMNELRQSGGIVYWDLYSSHWGANLDYDSWGGNGSQPWAGFGEERITVDSQMVRRPGTYDIIFCYYNGWDNYNSPNQATIEWWGINAGQNINVGGKNFKTTVNKGECVYAGTLNTH